MERLFLLIFLIVTVTSFEQQNLNANYLYNKTIKSYLTFVNNGRNIKFDTLYIEGSDTADYHLVRKVHNTVIKVLTSSGLADKIDQDQTFFYIKLAPIKITEKTLVVAIFRYQVEIEDGEKIVGAQRRFEQVLFTANKKRTKYKFQEIKTGYGNCTIYFRFDKVKRKLLESRKICI